MNDIAQAVRILRTGGLVAFPTETVYGLGADATNSLAVRRIFAAKGRPSTNPIIVHVADETVARRYAASWPQAAANLATKFWPGPLTLVVPRSGLLAAEVSAGRETVGLRSPDHPLALELLRAFDGPVAAPSANRSTRISPTTAQHVVDELGDAVDLILSGGPCRVGIESTVIDLSGDTPMILRPGAITADQIAGVIGPVNIFQGSVDPLISAASPGQHAIHYAPVAAAYRFTRENCDEVLTLCQGHRGEYAVLSIGRLPDRLEREGRIYVDRVTELPGSPDDYARELYSALRQLDRPDIRMIFVEMPPDEPAWAAIRDRLTRATRPLIPSTQ